MCIQQHFPVKGLQSCEKFEIRSGLNRRSRPNPLFPVYQSSLFRIPGCSENMGIQKLRSAEQLNQLEFWNIGAIQYKYRILEYWGSPITMVWKSRDYDHEVMSVFHTFPFPSSLLGSENTMSSVFMAIKPPLTYLVLSLARGLERKGSLGTSDQDELNHISVTLSPILLNLEEKCDIDRKVICFSLPYMSVSPGDKYHHCSMRKSNSLSLA